MKEAPAKVDWKVEGMTCSNCALTISKYLQKEGMENISVNALGGDVSFAMSNGHTNDEKIRKGIEDLGYRVITGEALAPARKTFLNTPLQRFWFCLPFTLVLMLHMIPGLHTILPHWLMEPWVQGVICLPVFITGMLYFGKSAWKSIRNGMPNMNVLIAMGAAAAFIYSCLAAIMHLGAEHIYFESAATIITLVFLGYWMEDAAVATTQKALNALSSEQKIIANMIAFDDEHKEHIFPVEGASLKTGDLILIRTGEHVPADCRILWGNCSVDESIITGESSPVEKNAKEDLIGGSILAEGTVKAQVTRTGKESVLSMILDLAQKAQGEKPPVQQMADRISAIFVPAVLIIAALTLCINYFFFAIPFDASLMRSIAVLVIACPCAMGLATPAAIAVGLGRAAGNGILFKDAKSLELFKNIRTVVFDKTGTLTTGAFRVTAIKTSMDENEFGRIAYSLEKFSNHPIANAVAKHFQHTGKAIRWKEVKEVKGLGVTAVDNENNKYAIGSYQVAPGLEKGHSIYLVKNSATLGWIDVADELRPGAKEVVAWFNARNIKTVLLSGDHADKCRDTAKECSIDEWYAEQAPAQKLEIIAQLNMAAPTAMIGDGINDAAALAKATIGVSLSDAAGIARQHSQVVLMNRGLKQLPMALALGKHTYLTIQQNLFWAFAYNIVAIPIAALGLLVPGIAALVMGLSDVVLAVNSLRLRWKKIV